MTQTKRAAFYIAHGDSYRTEAARSACSFALHDNADMWLFSDGGSRAPFTHVSRLPERQSVHWFLDATRYFVLAVKRLAAEGYDKLMYFDTDTHICQPLDGLCQPLDGLWQMLDKFDFCGAYAPGRSTQDTVEPIPDAFPEINIGVLGLRTNQRTINLLDDWWTRYHANQDVYCNNDQAPLREALWHNYAGVRLGILPVEYNLRFGFGSAFRGAVKVLHGRTKKGQTYGGVCEAVNARPNLFRAWKQGEL